MEKIHENVHVFVLSCFYVKLPTSPSIIILLVLLT